MFEMCTIKRYPVVLIPFEITTWNAMSTHAFKQWVSQTSDGIIFVRGTSNGSILVSYCPRDVDSTHMLSQYLNPSFIHYWRYQDSPFSNCWGEFADRRCRLIDSSQLEQTISNDHHVLQLAGKITLRLENGHQVLLSNAIDVRTLI